MIDTDKLLPVVFVDDDEPQNISFPLPGILSGRPYVLLGQVANIEDGTMRGIRHYILLDLRTGKIMPGMYHGDRFRFVDIEDNIF